MMTVNPFVLPISNTDIDLIEVSPEILAKIEDFGEENNNSPTILNKCWRWIRIYLKKFRGLHEKRPKRLPWQEYIWSFIGALLGIAAITFFHFRLLEK
jgi:hypothetical protein